MNTEVIETKTQSNSISLNLDARVITNLPPDVRDRLLDYLSQWGDPQEQLRMIDLLREAHGPLLFLLDYQAQAYYQAGQFEQALDLIERRQRRSTTIASQVLEARALLATGHEAHARNVADDISQAYPTNLLAISGAAEIYTGLGHFDQGRALLDAYLTRRANDQEAVLVLAQLAYQAGNSALADEYVQRLGAGIPSALDSQELQKLQRLLEALDKQESVKALQLELARRHDVELQALQQALAPFTDTSITAIDPVQLYNQLSGPESVPVNKQEQRSIQLEAVRHFGFMKLRSGQIEVMASVLRGESILTVMPTGAGKSLCYQLPALTLPKATLVISPLIALMKDQVESLPTAARSRATFINSTLNEEELAARMAGVARGDYKLIYAAPERLRQRTFLRALREAGLALFVVDEAHCVSLWGHDFRPDYLFIQEARRELGNPTALAMTATAPPRVRDEIVDYMSNDGNQLATTKRPRVMLLDIFRSNLHLSALRFQNEEDKLAALLKFVTETPGSGIVYVNSRHKSETLAFQLREAGIQAEAYHAGLTDRGAVQDRFMSNKTRVVVATVAFGMGIDKADIRFIVHFHPSRSLAAYYQEVGRAGRNGQPSQGVLFYSNNDWANLRRWAKADEYNPEFLERVYAAIATQLGVEVSNEGATEEDGAKEQGAEGKEQGAGSKEQGTGGKAQGAGRVLDGLSATGPVDARRLQQVLNADETTVRVAVSILERAELLSRSFDVPQEVEISLPRRISDKAKQDQEFMYLLKGLALGPGQNAVFKSVDVAKFMEWPLYDIESLLLDWEAAGYLTLKSGKRAMLIELTSRPADLRQRLERLLIQSSAVAQRRIDEMIGYATAETCRHGYISAHFGSPPRNKCDVCDNCTGVRPALPVGSEEPLHVPDDADIEPMIIDSLISLPKPVGRGGLARILSGSLRAPVTPDKARHHGRLKGLGEETILNYIDDLLAENRLRQYERQGYMVLAPTTRGRVEAEIWLTEHPELGEMAPPPESPEGEPAELPEEAEKYTALQKALWLWRRRSAEELGQPPYVIMSNELMMRIAELRPQSMDDLSGLPGMGEQRLQRFGPTILDLVKLNPAHSGDDNLLHSQREAQTATAEEIKQKVQSKLAAVSPQVEKRIFLKLQELRQKKAITERSKPYLVASNTLLKSISQTAPTTREELEKILGFRTSGFQDEVERILVVVREAQG